MMLYDNSFHSISHNKKKKELKEKESNFYKIEDKFLCKFVRFNYKKMQKGKRKCKRERHSKM
jgi:hypothetical protein